MPEPGLPNQRRRYPVTLAMLPLHCPTPETSLWNSHPRVFLPIEQAGEARCPYCGTVFFLQDEGTQTKSSPIRPA